jgi:hypothetical protein
MSEYYNIEGYDPLFELGLFKENSPCCRVIPERVSVDPIMLASLVVALFETAMQAVPDSDQIAFENGFRDALEVLLEERFDYDVIKKYPEDE